MGRISDKPWYLWLGFSLPALLIFLQSVAPFEPTFRAQNISVWTGILGAIAVLLLWIAYKGFTSLADNVFRSFVLLLALGWLVQVVMQLLDGYTFNHTTYFVPLFLFLLFLKPPTKKDFYLAGLVLGYSLALIIVVSLALGGNLGIPNGFDVPDNGASRFFFLSDLFGVETRWGGPFGSVNYATPVGGLLLFLAAFYRRWHRAIFVIIGLLVLLLGQARTTYFAVAFALLALVLWSSWFSKFRFASVARWISASLAAAVSVAYIASIDPTLNGRTPIWTDYWELTRESLILGAGTSGITGYVADASLNNPTGVFHLHAHSVYLDGLTRYGLVWLLLSMIVFIFAFTIAFKARKGAITSRGIALVTFIFFAGLTETIFSWAYVTIYMLSLIYVVGLSNGSSEKPQTNTDSGGVQKALEKEY